MNKTDSSKEKAATVAPEAAKQNRRHDYHANSLPAQRQRIAAWFSNTSGFLTTEQARRDLDVMHPAGRIKELRERGFIIVTHMVNRPTIAGNMHRMAIYSCNKRGRA